MYLLLTTDASDTAATRAFRLAVKKRLHAFNKDTLVQLEQQERIQKLEETFRSVQAEYLRITEKFAV